MSNKNQPKESNKYGSRLREMTAVLRKHGITGGLTPEKLRTAKPDLCILHPLPRVNEISVAVDDDPRACYFKQVKNGRYIRMALILKLLGIE